MFPELEVLDHIRGQRREPTFAALLLRLLLWGVPAMFMLRATTWQFIELWTGAVSVWTLGYDVLLLAAFTGIVGLCHWHSRRCYEYGVDRATGLGGRLYRAFNALVGRQGKDHFDILHDAAMRDARDELLAFSLVKPRQRWGRIVAVRPTWTCADGVVDSFNAKTSFLMLTPLLGDHLRQSRFEITYADGDVPREEVIQTALPRLLLACGQALDPTAAELVYPHCFGQSHRPGAQAVAKTTVPVQDASPAAMAAAWKPCEN